MELGPSSLESPVMYKKYGFLETSETPSLKKLMAGKHFE
jgi:hypothetical protein